MAYRRIASFIGILLSIGLVEGVLSAPSLAQQTSESSSETRDRLAFAVSPPRMEVMLDSASASATGAIQVINMSQQEIPLQVNAASWVLDETNQLEAVPPTANSVTNALLISPAQFVLPAAGQQTVRFAIQPKVELPPGEHRLILLVAPQPRAAAQAEGVSVSTVVQLGSVVYVNVGEPIREATLHGITLDPVNPTGVEFDISSTGNAHVRLDGQYAIWRASEYPGAENTAPIVPREGEDPFPQGVVNVESIRDTPILADTRRTVLQELTQTLDPGEYVLDINGSLIDAPIDTGLPFEVTRQQVSRSSGPGSSEN